jgi:murein DD-endopeptidase MepM/ murein hydrolase activator NlpD
MVLLLLLALLPGPCLLGPPAEGRVVHGFAPEGLYGGHWGIDIAVDIGTPVGAAAPAGNETVTVYHGGGVRTSYSYLDSRTVAAGSSVGAGSVVGTSGNPHGAPGIHFSLRIDDRYVDPLGACGASDSPSAALRLAPVLSTYPVLRAPWSSRRDVRPATHRPSHSW